MKFTEYELSLAAAMSHLMAQAQNRPTRGDVQRHFAALIDEGERAFEEAEAGLIAAALTTPDAFGRVLGGRLSRVAIGRGLQDGTFDLLALVDSLRARDTCETKSLDEYVADRLASLTPVVMTWQRDLGLYLMYLLTQELLRSSDVFYVIWRARSAPFETEEAIDRNLTGVN